MKTTYPGIFAKNLYRISIAYLLLLLLAPQTLLADVPVIAAAADLRLALDEVAAQFQAKTGQSVRISYGSSGNFRRQIEQGAPYQLYMSADENYVLDLEHGGHTLDQGVLYAIGRVVIFSPNNSVLIPDAELKDLSLALNSGKLNRFAIANPEHAPYGRAAREVLQHAGLWDFIHPRLVLGENAAQAAQFAYSGSTQGGIIPYSLALAPDISSKGRYVLLPAHFHKPLRQRMVLLQGAGDVAKAFYAFIQSPDASRIMQRYGFTRPQGY